MTKRTSTILIIGAFLVLIAGAIAILTLHPLSLDIMPATNTVSDTSKLPEGPATSSLPVLAPSMPEFQGITKWWNTPDGQPLTPASLKGKVVLVDFWTYSCINCIRTQPVLKAWWKAYADDGLVIVGVHTPEFAFEKVPENVEAALKKAGLEYPIALDADYATWNAYSNRYWPAGYFFDRQGRLRFAHFGEGNYDEQERVIRELLMEGSTLNQAETHADSSPTANGEQTPETYFGLSRQERFVNAQTMHDNAPADYLLGEPANDQWTVGGRWAFLPERAESLASGNTFRMNFDSNAFYLVLGSPDGPRRIKIVVDGKETGDLTVDAKQLYTIAEFPQAGRHTVELNMTDAGVQFYSATFGK